VCQRPSFGPDRPGRADGDVWGGQDREIRRAYFEQGRSIKEIVRTLSVSRSTVRKVVRGRQTEFKYARDVQPTPKFGEWVEPLIEILEIESKLAKRERRSTQRLYEELRGRGYDGAHDSVHRFVKSWREERARVPVHAYVPMSFAPGEAYQFDWSHETITLQGLPLTVKAAHMKLSHSRMPFVRVYFRETQELVFDAHDKAFRFYGGLCRRGIYDNIRQIRCICRRPRWKRSSWARRAATTPACLANVLPPSDRAGGLHAGVGLGERPGREPGR
jgi:transposase